MGADKYTTSVSGIIVASLELNMKGGIGSGTFRWSTPEESEFRRDPEKISEGGVFFSTKEFKNEEADEFNVGLEFGYGSGILDDKLQLVGDNAHPSGSYRRCSSWGCGRPIGT